MISGAWLCLFAPLAGTLAITLLGMRIPRAAAGWISTASVFIAFAGAVWSFFGLRSHGTAKPVISTAWTWLQADGFKVGLSVIVDPLSTMMMLVVSGVGGLIVLYSIGYMHGDDEERRYFAYMSLFVFSMLLLVQGGNMLLLLAGWGLVGLSSYLLIGFWHERPSAVAAAKKAFVMNAFGDATMALSLFILIAYGHSLSFAASFNTAAHLSNTMVSLVALGLLGGAVAKSAQVPLHTWLPDAMEGPTPVSALIHAATMVTAGVYLIARTNPIFEQARTVQLIAAGLGAITLLMAGLIALVQTDIKRVIAYSTMSQIGYMFVAVGVGTYANGMFHLMTHAFFKALLFLAAGVAIHALSGEQDIRKMRNLAAAMPWTRWAFLVGSLALVGIPPFSGFFSKDSIIAAAMHDHWYGIVLALACLAGTFLTGIYAFRLYFVVFGRSGDPAPDLHGHGAGSAGGRAAGARPEDVPASDGHGEGPWTMLLPVGVLSVLAVIGGWIQFAPFWTPITRWLEPVAATLPVAEATNTDELIASVAAVALGLAGILTAWVLYGARRRAVPHMPALQRLLEHKFYWDELYDAAFYKPAAALSALTRRDVEEGFVLPAGPDIGETAFDTGRGVRRLQTGLLRTYVFLLGTGMAVLAIIFLLVK